MNPVCEKYWISPNGQSNLFAGEVSGGENYSNLFTTSPATYLLLLLLRQPISKLDTHALSLTPWLQLAWFLIISYWIWAFNSWKCNGGSVLEPPCSYAHVSTYSDSDSMLTQNNFIAVKFDSVFRFNLYHLHQILKRKLCGVLPN